MNLRNVLPPLLRIQVAACMLLGAGCSPAVYKSIQTSLPARPADSPVAVYEQTDSVPGNAKVIGWLKIEDTGFTTGCKYDQVIETAKIVTNESGGNALHVTEHKKPSAFGSSCHQIAADMLYLADSPSQFLPGPADGDGIGVPVQNQEQAFVATKVRKIPKQQKPTNTLLLNAGYAGISSEFIVPQGFTGNPKSGYSISAAYQWTSRKGLGAGLYYSGYFSHVTPVELGGKFSIRVHYVAPEFVVRESVGKRWYLGGSVGFGYASYAERYEQFSGSIGGWGFHLNLNAEFRITEYIGIGICLNEHFTRFSKMDSSLEQAGTNTRSSGEQKSLKGGITFSSINGGLRFYF